MEKMPSFESKKSEREQAEAVLRSSFQEFNENADKVNSQEPSVRQEIFKFIKDHIDDVAVPMAGALSGAFIGNAENINSAMQGLISNDPNELIIKLGVAGLVVGAGFQTFLKLLNKDN